MKRPEYGTVYRHLCTHSHNGASALVERHAHGKRDFGKLEFYDEINQGMVDTFFVFLNDYLITSAYIVDGIVGKQITQAIDPIAAEFKSLQEAIQRDMGLGGS